MSIDYRLQVCKYSFTLTFMERERMSESDNKCEMYCEYYYFYLFFRTESKHIPNKMKLIQMVKQNGRCSLYGTKYSRMDQLKFVEDSF